MNGDPTLECSLTSSLDLTNSLRTSSSLWLTWRSCSLTESVESEEMTSGSGGTRATSRERLVGCLPRHSGFSTYLWSEEVSWPRSQHGLVSAESASSSTSADRGSVRFWPVQHLGSLHLWMALRASVALASTEVDLHKGLVGMGVPDVTPMTIKSVARLEGLFGGVCVCIFGSSPKRTPPPPPLVLPGGILYSPDGRLTVRSAIPQMSLWVWPLRTVSQSVQGHGVKVWRTL
ncbi:hypothetical protein BHM03_00042493 [Ensete ventricosum]|nr:hypothetical protein BHM03_00042493 [Ensete ventricosum]